jgi:DNA-directed RNA polymerase II subunit RPB2
VENASVYLGIGEGGIVDRVIVSKNEVKQTVIKVKIRQVRYPIIGDKFSPRSAQKGTIGLVMPEVDMPFVAAGPNAGLRPDIIINPHCIPSRMTLGFLIEMIASKLVLMTGERFNATTFRPFDLEALRQNLKAYGFNPNGTEVMINGMTGKLMKAEIYMGPCYYMALRHHVQDKLQMRSRGAINPISHQPVPGRSRIGGAGLRFGEMERDSLISHGASAMLLDRLMACSDAYRTVWCQTCGTIAISDAVSQTSMCRKCKDKGNFGNLTIPYVYKLLIHLLNGLGINVTHGLQVLEP